LSRTVASVGTAVSRELGASRLARSSAAFGGDAAGATSPWPLQRGPALDAARSAVQSLAASRAGLAADRRAMDLASTLDDRPTGFACSASPAAPRRPHNGAGLISLGRGAD